MPDLRTDQHPPPDLTLNGIAVEDTFAEAFDMAATAVIITAETPAWAMIAAGTMTGFATSVIGCGVEAGVAAEVPPDATPDGRPGVRVLLFGFDRPSLQAQLVKRVGQCVLTSPGSACFAGADGVARLKLGSALRVFGDGHQVAKRLEGRRFWRIPVMDGEFVCEHDTGAVEGAVGGGNLLFLGRDFAGTLACAEAAVASARTIPDVILPFPGGVVRSGSKIGSRYTGMIASTNDAYCPTLKGRPGSALDPEVGVVLEIVIDGLSSDAVAAAMEAALHAAAAVGEANGLLKITAGNYGGQLGRHHFHLADLLL